MWVVCNPAIPLQIHKGFLEVKVEIRLPFIRRPKKSDGTLHQKVPHNGILPAITGLGHAGTQIDHMIGGHPLNLWGDRNTTNPTCAAVPYLFPPLKPPRWPSKCCHHWWIAPGRPSEQRDVFGWVEESRRPRRRVRGPVEEATLHSHAINESRNISLILVEAVSGIV